MDLNKVHTIYFIGIAGIGMSAVAALSKKMGFEVSGSDQEKVYPPAVDVLTQNNIKFYRGYHATHIQNYDLVVIGAGENPNENPEVTEIIKKGMPFVSFAELLYALTKDKFRIVVTGTHGKTTTTALLAWALQQANKESGFFIGGYSRDFKTNFSLIHSSPYFVMEGDEYYSSFFDKRPKFLHLHPSLLLINNLDLDHFDYYRNLEDLQEKFKKLIKTLPPEGVIVACHDDVNLKKILKNSERKVIWYGLKGNNLTWKGEKIHYQDNFLVFTARNLENKEQAVIKLKIYGKHNVLNCLATIATLDYLKIPLEQYKNSLAEFQGPRRRFEVVGEISGITVIDDYAHHPTAVKTTLEAVRARYLQQKIWVVFEPHTFSRTKATLEQLAESFQAADEVIIPDIYPAREKFQKSMITSQDVVDQIKKFQQNVHYLPDREKVLNYLLKHLKPNSIVVIMAVGDFNQVASLLINRLKGWKQLKF